MNIKVTGADRAKRRERGYTFVEILIVFGILIALGIAALFFFTQQGRATEYRQVGENIARVINTERSIRTGPISAAAAANAVAQALRDSPVVQGVVTVTGNNATDAGAAGCNGAEAGDVGIRITTPAVGARVPDQNAAGLLQESIHGALENMFAQRSANEFIVGAAATTATTAAVALSESDQAVGPNPGAATPTTNLVINICLANT